MAHRKLGAAVLSALLVLGCGSYDSKPGAGSGSGQKFGAIITPPFGAAWSDNGTTISTTEALNVTGAATFTNGWTSLLSTSLNKSTSDGAAPEQDFIARNGDWATGIDVANTTPARDFVLVEQRGSYSFEDGVENSTTTLTSAAQGGFDSSLVGATISGANIPGATTVSSVTNATTLVMSAAATATTSGVRITITRGTTNDVVYMKHRGAQAPTLGIGVTPPDGSARCQIAGSDTENAMAELSLRVGPSQTGKALDIHDSTPVDRLWVDSGFYVSGNHPLGGAMYVQADSTNNRAVVLADNAKATFYGFTFPGSSESRYRYINGAVDIWRGDTSGGFTTFGATSVQSTLAVTGATTANAQTTMTNTTQASERLRFAGQEFLAASTTDTNGPTFVLGENRTNQRQVWLLDSANTTQNSSNAALMLQIGSNTGPGVSAISTDGSTGKTLTLQTNGALTVTGGTIAITGHVRTIGSAVSFGSCGTGPACNSATCNDTAGTFTTGTTTTTCTLTFAATYTGADDAACIVINKSTGATQACPSTATTLPCTGLVASTKYTYVCLGHAS